MRPVLAAVLIACLPSLVRAQVTAPTSTSEEREAILAIVQKFFDTMAAADVEGNRAVLTPEARFYALQEKPGGPTTVRSSSTEEWLKQLATGKRKVRERMWDPEVRVHGGIAVVWTPYDFWIDGKFSHCGVDAFNLVKTPEGWKLSGGTYTVERTGCQPSPLGPLK